jgi:hypothetical protein
LRAFCLQALVLGAKRVQLAGTDAELINLGSEPLQFFSVLASPLGFLAGGLELLKLGVVLAEFFKVYGGHLKGRVLVAQFEELAGLHSEHNQAAKEEQSKGERREQASPKWLGLHGASRRGLRLRQADVHEQLLLKSRWRRWAGRFAEERFNLCFIHGWQ